EREVRHSAEDVAQEVKHQFNDNEQVPPAEEAGKGTEQAEGSTTEGEGGTLKDKFDNVEREVRHSAENAAQEVKHQFNDNEQVPPVEEAGKGTEQHDDL
ncbi:MAG: hypothetical protein WCP46_07125, partial [Alphaproteobacteria bacterium]